MKKKKKVLFYGNCQASGLAKILSLHESFLDKYEIEPDEPLSPSELFNHNG